ncbi:zinc ribbon domain-containing protein [Helicobacter mehlei]
MKLSERVYQCEACGVVLDRDFNASVNLVQHLAGRDSTEFTSADTAPHAGSPALLSDLATNRLATRMVKQEYNRNQLPILYNFFKFIRFYVVL